MMKKVMGIAWMALGLMSLAHAEGEGGGLWDSIKSAAGQIATGVEQGVKADMSGESLVTGTVEISSPIVGYATCFSNSPGSAISRRPITSLSQGEGFPSIIMTRSGVVSSGACAELKKNGLLVPPAKTKAGVAASGDSCPEAGRRRTPLEIRIAAICTDRDAQYISADDAARKIAALKRGDVVR